MCTRLLSLELGCMTNDVHADPGSGEGVVIVEATPSPTPTINDVVLYLTPY